MIIKTKDYEIEVGSHRSRFIPEYSIYNDGLKYWDYDNDRTVPWKYRYVPHSNLTYVRCFNAWGNLNWIPHDT